MSYKTSLSDEHLETLDDVFRKILEFHESEHPGKPITYGAHGRVKVTPSGRVRLSDAEMARLEQMIRDHNQRPDVESPTVWL